MKFTTYMSLVIRFMARILPQNKRHRVMYLASKRVKYGLANKGPCLREIANKNKDFLRDRKP